MNLKYMTKKELIEKLNDLEWESNWKAYNHTAPEYDVTFDATILKLYTQSELETDKTSEKLQNIFGVNTEKLRSILKNNEFNKKLISSTLNLCFEEFMTHVASDNSKISEHIRKNFGVNSQKLRGRNTRNLIQLLMLIDNDSSITAEKASEILEVSSRSVENYIASLKEMNMIIRKGSDKSGKWILSKRT